MKRQDYTVPEKLWALVEPLLPTEEARPQGGRPPVPSYRIFGGVLYRLRTGCQWAAVPRHFGTSSTLQRRFQQWAESGLMDKVFDAALKFYDDLKGIGWEWMSMDASFVKAPKGGDATGPNPTDRAKSGSKRHIVTDSRGVPVAVNVSAANVADCRMVDETLEALPITFAADGNAACNLCMDKAYDSKKVEREVKLRGLVPHIRRRGEPPLVGRYRGKPRRWVVERCNSWHNQFRGLKTRWERGSINYRGLVLLGSAIIAIQNAIGAI
jgi:putative transposase